MECARALGKFTESCRHRQCDGCTPAPAASPRTLRSPRHTRRGTHPPPTPNQEAQGWRSGWLNLQCPGWARQPALPSCPGMLDMLVKLYAAHAACQQAHPSLLLVGSASRLTLTYSTPSIVRLTLSLVMAVWLGTGIVVSFRLCAYAMRSTWQQGVQRVVSARMQDCKR